MEESDATFMHQRLGVAEGADCALAAAGELPHSLAVADMEEVRVYFATQAEAEAFVAAFGAVRRELPSLEKLVAENARLREGLADLVENWRTGVEEARRQGLGTSESRTTVRICADELAAVLERTT